MVVEDLNVQHISHALLQVSENAIDSDAVKVFDKNGDGQTERSDWSAPFGDMGPQGEVVKDYIFK